MLTLSGRRCINSIYPLDISSGMPNDLVTMRARSDVLELAILGQLQDAPLHGYELRKRRNATLGTVRALSYGSRYPALKSLTAAGLLAAGDTPGLPPATAGTR